MLSWIMDCKCINPRLFSGEKIKAKTSVEAIFRFMELKAELLLVNIIKNVSDGWCLRCELGHCICIYVSSIWCIVLYLTWLGQLCSALSSAQPHSTAVGQATLTLVHHTIMDLDILSVQGDLMLHTGWLPATKQTPVTYDHGFTFNPLLLKSPHL